MSSDDKHLDATLASAGIDLRSMADVVVTKSDAGASKPDPDVGEVALLEAGARVVYREVAHLLVELDRALEIVSLAGAASE